MAIDLNQLRELLAGAFSFRLEAFEQISVAPNGLSIALLIVLLVGLSLAIGQAIVLFINRVQPIRFIFSLLISAILYTFGYLFLVFSTWLICLVPWSVHISFETLARVLGLSYTPLLFSFLAALPYLGVPIYSLLSVWHLLALVVSFSAVAKVPITEAFGYVAFGWIILQILQQSIGQPIANIGRWLANTVAGVELVTRQEDLAKLVQTGLGQAALPLIRNPQAIVPEAQQLIQTARQRLEEAFTLPEPPLSDAIAIATKGRPDDLKNRLMMTTGLVGIFGLTYVVAILLDPIREAIFGWHDSLPDWFRFIFDLIWIGVLAIAVAGLLAPLETLGWWAGWYDDEIDTTVNLGSLAEPIQDPQTISRYVIYLDGIGQSSSEYLPDVEDFLDALTPALPDDIALIRGLMTYSVLNNPLNEDRPLAFLWKLADKLRFANPASLLGLMVNIRNVLIVSVSADRRYGPLYNQGIAQIMYNALIKHGYPLNSGVPVTLIGYSGGGQMSAAAAPFLRRAIDAPISVISLGGVISGNCNVLKLEHLYHLVGDKDSVEKLGPIMFAGRWPMLPLSYWNRAKHLGKISLISLGSVGHQVPGGMLDPKAYLPDGRSYLQQTIDYILRILQGQLLTAQHRLPRKPSNYDLYQQAAFNRPDYYPIAQTVDFNWYRPIGQWMGRLILPQKQDRSQIRGVLFEVHHAPAVYQHLVGQVVKLKWHDQTDLKNLVRAVTRDVHFSVHAEYTSEYGGLIHPERLNHWQQVGPLESLAGSHPVDDLIVMLPGEVTVEETDSHLTIAPTHLPSTILRIDCQPVQITGRYYALVQFQQPIAGTDHFQVIHFNPRSRQFDGPIETVRMPPVVADQNGCFPSTSREIEKSAPNEMGWYIYGAKDAAGLFVVQSLAPRALLRLQPDRAIFGRKPAYQYIRRQAWADLAAQKGKISSVLLSPTDQPIQAAINEWKVGDRALLLHVYGGIGGDKKEPTAATPIFFGHFAYGSATVVEEPLANELRFEIEYYQVYTHNTDGLVAGTLHWSRFMGDRQFGWAGVRPTCDMLIKLDAFTNSYDINGVQRSALGVMIQQLQAMTARYRVGNGTGGTYVGPANNCSQDSNQALFASIRQIEQAIKTNPIVHEWLVKHPEQQGRARQLAQLSRALRRELQPLGSPRSDWDKNEYNLGCTLEDAPLQNLRIGLSSWRTLFPRLASDTIARVFLRHNASVWVLRTTQIGGNDPDIEPIAPMTL